MAPKNIDTHVAKPDNIRRKRNILAATLLAIGVLIVAAVVWRVFFY